jgi:hypothetical protein
MAGSAPMTNTLAIWIGIVLAACVAADALLFDWTYSMFVAREFLGVLRWMAFWR